MRTFSIAILVIGLAQMSALGGTITFSPQKATVDLAAGDSTLVKFDVFIYDLADIGDAFGAVSILFGSDDLEFVSFDFDFPLDCVDCVPVTLNPGFGVYAHELKAVWVFFTATIPVFAPRLLGSIVVDVTGLGPGNHQIIVDGLNDGNRSFVMNTVNGAVGTLAGIGSINIVPETDIDPCGNGVIDAGEACDDGSSNSDTMPDACRTDCSLATCGDNVKDSIEQCDGADIGDCPGSCAGDCACLPVEIPTLSAWGIAVLTLSLLAICRSGRFTRL